VSGFSRTFRPSAWRRTLHPSRKRHSDTSAGPGRPRPRSADGPL